MPGITGVLFDSGDVLMRPAGGRWWPKPPLATWLADRVVRGDVDVALAAGMEYLVAHHDVPDAAEVAVLTRHHEVVLGALVDGFPATLPGRLAAATVETPDQAPFPHVAPVLHRLRAAGVALGVVSNAWPSLRRRYAAAGLEGLFDVFVVSAEVGCVKPDPAIYRLALRGLGLPAEDVLFVDDDLASVGAAEGAGMPGLVLDRYGGGSDLGTVEALVAGA